MTCDIHITKCLPHTKNKQNPNQTFLALRLERILYATLQSGFNLIYSTVLATHFEYEQRQEFPLSGVKLHSSKSYLNASVFSIRPEISPVQAGWEVIFHDVLIIVLSALCNHPRDFRWSIELDLNPLPFVVSLSGPPSTITLRSHGVDSRVICAMIFVPNTWGTESSVRYFAILDTKLHTFSRCLKMSRKQET